MDVDEKEFNKLMADNSIPLIIRSGLALSKKKEKYKILFCYGTFMKKKVLESVVGHKVDFKDDKLSGYIRVCGKLKDREKDGKFCKLIKSKNGNVEGKIVELTEEDFDKTDRWENKYQLKKITLNSGVKAYAYFLKEEAQDEITPDKNNPDKP